MGFLNTMTTVLQPNEWYADGQTHFNTSVGDPSDQHAVVREIDLLMTGGRLGPNAHSVITRTYAKKYAQGDLKAALAAAQELFLFTAEFHATNLDSARNVPRATLPEVPGADRPYKAIVYLYLGGGADTFNLLVPTGGCTGANLYTQYTQLRGTNAIPTDRLQPITTTNPQPCSAWGVHQRMTTLKQTYDDGDAAFIANVGPLVAPITYNSLKQGAPRPPSLYAHTHRRSPRRTCTLRSRLRPRACLGASARRWRPRSRVENQLTASRATRLPATPRFSRAPPGRPKSFRTHRAPCG